MGTTPPTPSCLAMTTTRIQKNTLALFSRPVRRSRGRGEPVLPWPKLSCRKNGAATFREAQGAFREFRERWRNNYPAMVKRLERDLPELLSFFSLPRHLWRSLRTTNITERCFVEVRRRTRPMVCFVNVQSVDRIVSRSLTVSTKSGETASSGLLHNQLDITAISGSCITGGR